MSETDEGRWLSVKDYPPRDLQVVIVHGGPAVYRDGTFFTLVEYPYGAREIKWDVTHYMLLEALPTPPTTTQE